jgi:dephospho-CoA kinase
MDAATAAARVDAQAPQAEKIARANVVIDTDGTMNETVAQFEAAWAGLIADH